ncbi:hypothetical protein J3A83DRAFT_4400604 [Scleroderma citrinum]
MDTSLEECRYLLRSRYTPDWILSWQGTKKNRSLRGDGVLYDVEIGQKFSVDPLRPNPANRCVPIYEVTPIPESDDKVIIVMPLLRGHSSPPFCTAGEAVECFRQLFEGLSFMLKNRMAHWNCINLNMVVDATGFGIEFDVFHPVFPFMKREFAGYAHFKTRTRQPVKYDFIDFDLSRYYDPSIRQTPRSSDVGRWQGSPRVPKFQ